MQSPYSYDVTLLWCFSQVRFGSSVKAACDDFGIDYFAPDATDIPYWARRRNRNAALMDCDFGEYEGPLGCRPLAASKLLTSDTLDELRAFYQRKYPDWSPAKLERAVIDKNAQSPRAPLVKIRAMQRQQAQMYVDCFRRVAESCPFELFLQKSRKEWQRRSNESAPVAWRRIVTGKPTKVDASTLSDDDLLGLDSFVLIQICDLGGPRLGR